MNKATKEKQNAQVTMDKVADAALAIQKKQAQNNPIEKARQVLARQQFSVNPGGIYDL